MDLPTWERAHLLEGGYAPHLFFKIHGDFDGELQVDQERHRCAGLPKGLQLDFFRKDDESGAFNFGLTDSLNLSLKDLAPGTLGTIQTSPSCVVLRGEVEEHASLDYLRDAVGIVQSMLETEGVAVFDPFVLSWFSPEDWSARHFVQDAFRPFEHVTIIVSEDGPAGHSWYHTRGMIKFGRPDISVREVPPELGGRVQELCDRYIAHMALGGVVPDGEVVRMEGLPNWVCQTRGSFDDPDFNNLHLAIGVGEPS